MGDGAGFCMPKDIRHAQSNIGPVCDWQSRNFINELYIHSHAFRRRNKQHFLDDFAQSV